MRKITLFITTLMMAGSLFAYEPKKENVTVKRNKVQYLEHCTRRGCCNEGIHHKWTYNTKSGKFTYMHCCSFERMWASLERARESYDVHLNVAKYKDETCSTCAFLEKYKSAYENGELNETEMEQYESIVNLHEAANNLKGVIEGKLAHAKTDTKSYWELCAKEEKEKIINRIPFITEENWKTITEEELFEKIDDFGRKCSKNYNPDNFLTKMERNEILNKK